jgi:hypothetical protein
MVDDGCVCVSFQIRLVGDDVLQRFIERDKKRQSGVRYYVSNNDKIGREVEMRWMVSGRGRSMIWDEVLKNKVMIPQRLVHKRLTALILTYTVFT